MWTSHDHTHTFSKCLVVLCDRLCSTFHGPQHRARRQVTRGGAQIRGPLQKAVLPPAPTCTAWFPLTRDRFVATWERTAVLPALGAAEPEGSSLFRPCSETELPFLWRLTVEHDEAVGFLSENPGGTIGPFPLWERPLPWERGCEGSLRRCASICNFYFENSFPFGCRGESSLKLVAKGVGKCCHR